VHQGHSKILKILPVLVLDEMMQLLSVTVTVTVTVRIRGINVGARTFIATGEADALDTRRGRLVELIKVNVKAWHRAPEVPPPCGQQACLNRLPGFQEGHDDMKEAVWQRAQPVWAASRASFDDTTHAGPLPEGIIKLHGVPCLEQFPR
jgi:hypothetical protein